ncbi:uncharacterized protein LOC115911843 [Camarhynchus parvulus]|uniref:uncharacterized protein LOC115911843 n=1 Tax=Geospiza parvula TaxID=87175 RepID=UPI001237F57C|nr:uncharacterized protein LOC115911843 [Camarhynchus parvulus]
MSYFGEAPIGLRDCGLGGCSVARGLCRTSLCHHQKKPYPGREGAAATAPTALQSSWGWGTETQSHTEQPWLPLCSSRREQRLLRQLPDLFSSRLPGARQGFTQMELPAGAWGSTHCSGAVCLVLGALCMAPRALHCPRGSIHCSQGSALLWGSVQCSRGSVRCSMGSVHRSGALYTTPRALCIALELCTPLPGLCASLWSSVHHSQGSVHRSGALYTAPRALCIALELCTPLPGLFASLWSSVHRSQSLCTLSSCSFFKELLVLPRLLPSPARSSCCITATSQPPSASPRQPLTAGVPGHTSISQGPAGPLPMAFCSCSTQPAPGGPSSPSWVLPTLTSSQGWAVSLPATEELGPALPRAIFCCT